MNNNKYTDINKLNIAKLKVGGYIRYLKNNENNYKSGILINNNFPILKLKAFNSPKTWYVNSLESKIYYKEHTPKKTMRQLFENILLSY